MPSTFNFCTAIDKAYYPALVALARSFKANAGPGVKLSCIVYGDEALIERVEALGLAVIPNPEINAYLPTTKEWPVASPAMYARLLVPHLFKESCAWIDADCVILQPLAPLTKFVFAQPVGAVMASTTTLSAQVGGLDISDAPALFAGLLLFNRPNWIYNEITEKCFEVMNTRNDLDFKFVVQSVLNYVLRGKFYHLQYRWQEFANRGPISADCKIIHYVGGLPWKDEMKNTDIWRQYA